MNALLQPIAAVVSRHPRRIMGGLATLLLGTGVTAFGIAPLAPNPDHLPVTQRIESVESATFVDRDQLEAHAPFTLFRSDVTRRDDSIQSLLQRLGVDDSQAAAFFRSNSTARQLLAGRAGKLVSVETDAQHRIQRFHARWLAADQASTYQDLVVERSGKEFSARIDQGTLTTSTRLNGGTIRSSLYAATDDARLPDSIANQLAELFSADIDFRRDLRVGDRFSVVYETLEAEGEVLRYGKLLSAEFVNKGKSYQMLWFQEPGKKGGYYTFDGQSMKRAFLASPVAFSRVSSGYGMRFHPISGGRKAHLGIDFAAPTGTPVRSVADGMVKFAGVQNGYGNVIFIQHHQQKTTAYAHLSHIAVRKGQRVEQGDIIGNVGSTGASTGPHLHFEYIVANQHQDPLTIARNNPGEPISPAARTAFNQVVHSVKGQLEFASTVVQASAE